MIITLLLVALVIVCVGWARSARSRRTYFDRPL